jgi:peptide/nickel transport system substrate-binding protein
MQIPVRRVALLALFLLATGCATPGAPRGAPVEAGQTQQQRPNRALVIVGREVTSLAGKPLQGRSGSVGGIVMPFNAALDMRDGAGTPIPQLAEALPQLNSETWRVFPDGRMETTYRLRPNAAWQDGVPLTAEDFTFSWRLYQTPAFGTSGPPIGYIEDVLAPTPATLVIHWKQLYPDAGVLGPAGFPPLPRHILETSFRDLDPAAFAALPFWVSEYVGVGPYRVERFEPGAWIEATAFDGYVFGRPKIDRMRLTFIQDPNTAMANLLTGEAHFIFDFLIGPEEARALEQQWQSRGEVGLVDETPTIVRFTSFQFRPQVLNPPLLADARVRKAIASAIDNEAALGAITYGKGRIIPGPVPDTHDWWPAVEGVVPRYQYDVRVAQQYLEDAGLARAADGLYRAPGGGPFSFEFAYIAQASNGRENAIFVDSLRRAGLDANPRPYSQAELLVPGARANFAALFTGSGTLLTSLTLQEIPQPDNRWQGQNYGAWENAELDRLKKTFDVTLEPSRRAQLLVDMALIYHDQLPGIAHYLTPTVNAWSPLLTGVTTRSRNPMVTPLDHIARWDWRA